jgi:hypothetical protein
MDLRGLMAPKAGKGMKLFKVSLFMTRRFMEWLFGCTLPILQAIAVM